MYAGKARGVQETAGEGCDLGSDPQKMTKNPETPLQNVFSSRFWSKNTVFRGFQPSGGSGREERGMKTYPCVDWSHDTYPHDKEGQQDCCGEGEGANPATSCSPTPP